MPFSNPTFHKSNVPLLQTFKANSSHPEHWCLTGKLTEEVKVRLLLQFPEKIKVAACYYFMIYLREVIIWSIHIKDMISLIIPSDMEIISSCPISASTSFSLKKWPLPEMQSSPYNSALLSSDAFQSNISKKLKRHNHYTKVYVLKTIQNCVFSKARGATAVFWKQEF